MWQARKRRGILHAPVAVLFVALQLLPAESASSLWAAGPSLTLPSSALLLLFILRLHWLPTSFSLFLKNVFDIFNNHSVLLLILPPFLISAWIPA